MYGFLLASVGVSAAAAIAEAKVLQAYLEALPDGERSAALARISAEAKEAERHRKALELAEAGRPRNFWGK
jgi:hypothetical protein